MIEELHVAEAQGIVLVVCAKQLDANRQRAVGYVCQNCILITSALESPAISNEATGNVAVIAFEVHCLEVRIFAGEVTVDAVDSIGHGEHILDENLEVIGHAVSGERSSIVGIGQVVSTRIGTEHAINLYLVNAICKPRDGLIHIHLGIVALGGVHLASLGTLVACSYLAFPAVEAVLEGRVGQQHRHVRTGLWLFRNGSLKHGVNLSSLCPYLFFGKQPFLQDVEGCSPRICAAGFFVGTQVVLQFVALRAGEVVVLFQILVRFLYLLLVGGVCFCTRLDAVAQLNEVVPGGHELVDILARLQRIQFALIAFHKALLCQNVLAELTFYVENSL